MPCCPICSSDKVYSLLNTLRCKRCKHIWKSGEEYPYRYAGPETPAKVLKKTEPLETRLEEKLDEYLTRSGGKFCITTMSWKAGDISPELFRRYLKRCVKDRALAETKDTYGRTWYSRPR